MSCLPYSVFQVTRVVIAESFCEVPEGFSQPNGYRHTRVVSQSLRLPPLDCIEAGKSDIDPLAVTVRTTRLPRRFLYPAHLPLCACG